MTVLSSQCACSPVPRAALFATPLDYIQVSFDGGAIDGVLIHAGIVIIEEPLDHWEMAMICCYVTRLLMRVASLGADKPLQDVQVPASETHTKASQ